MAPERTEPEALVDGYAGVVCDLDGVVYRGPAAVPHAVEALGRLGVGIVYATNNASRPPGEVAAHLARLGLEATADQVATSAQAGAAELATRLPSGSTVLAIGGPGVSEALLAVDLEPVLPEATRRGMAVTPAGVLQGYGAQVCAADLAEAAYAIAGGAQWVATNTDATLPTDRGTAPGNGTLVAAVQRAVGRDPFVVGKPFAPLYELCAERLGRPARDLLAVGDRLDTDIAGAAATGTDSVLVLTGVDSVTGVALAPPEHRPTYLVADLRGLFEPYAAARHDQGWFACGGDRRRIRGGEWEVAAQGTPLEAARAGLSALHQALDDGVLDPAGVTRLAALVDHWQ